MQVILIVMFVRVQKQVLLCTDELSVPLFCADAKFLGLMAVHHYLF